MFALIFFLVGWCLLFLGASTSGVGRFYPQVLVGAPLLSGYIGPALFIYTKQITTPIQTKTAETMTAAAQSTAAASITSTNT